MTHPLVSIVMPSFNQARFLERAIKSIYTQDYDHIELIVSDGGSTDGSVEILKNAEQAYPRLSWHSGQDNGPAHAINKALGKARGTIIGWLNSDDVYAPGAIGRAVEGFARHPEWIMCYGHGEHIDEHDATLARYPTLPPETGMDAFVEGCPICQPTVFFKVTILTLIGKLDERYRTSFDYEFWLRIFSEFPGRVGFIDALQAKSRLHADTITSNQRLTVALEGIELGHTYLGRGRLAWLRTYINEVRSDFEARQDMSTFGTHIQELLERIAPFVDASELQRLRENLRLVD